MKNAEEDWLQQPETIQISQISKEQKLPETKNRKKIKCRNNSSEILHEKTWTWLIKENLQRENESLLIAARNNAIMTNYVKAKID